MRNFLFVLIFVIAAIPDLHSQVSLSNNPLHDNVVFDANVPNKGFLLPYLTASARNNINNHPVKPPDGLMCYDTLEQKIFYFISYDGSSQKGNIAPPWGQWVAAIDYDELIKKKNQYNSLLTQLENNLKIIEDTINKYKAPVPWNEFSSDTTQVFHFFRPDVWNNFGTNHKARVKKDCFHNVYFQGILRMNLPCNLWSSPYNEDIIFHLPNGYYPKYNSSVIYPVSFSVTAIKWFLIDNRYVEDRSINFYRYFYGNGAVRFGGCTDWLNSAGGLLIAPTLIRLD